MIKIDSIPKGDGEFELEIEDETEDFDQLMLETAILLRYAYDAMLEAAEAAGEADPKREADTFFDRIVNEAINGGFTEDSKEIKLSNEQLQREKMRESLRIVDGYLEDETNKKKH